VAAKRLVVDANILARAVLGVRARSLLERYSAETAFFVPEHAIAEVREHLNAILLKRRLPVDRAIEVFEQIRGFLHELPSGFYVEHEAAARARLADPDDWPVLACSLLLECPIWTEDRDFFGTGVATWTSNRVEIFLEAVAEGLDTPAKG
jgi:predicted nucleic acid-binding protein